MPTKTIYISDDDQSLFSEAQEYAGGNVSAAIIKGLRLFTTQQAASKDGVIQQTIDIREDGVSKKNILWDVGSPQHNYPKKTARE